MSWKIVDHLTIYRDKNWYAAHPNVIRTPGGDILTLFHRSPPLGIAHHTHPLFDIRACRSSDDGQSWGQEEFIISDPRGGILDIGTHTLPDGSVYIHAATEELIHKNQDSLNNEWYDQPGIPFWTRSRDNGRSWTSPKRFPPLPDAVWGATAKHSGVCRSGLLALPDGRLLMPSKATDDPQGQWPFFGMLRISLDMGETWEYGGRIAEDEVAHFSEPTIHMTPSGRILVLFRCHPRRGMTSEDLDLVLALVYSDDGGETWSKWRPTTLRGCPGHMLSLRDNRIFVTVGTRWQGQRGCIARVLDPEGTDMDSAPDIIVRSDSPDQDCGYPWSVELNEGKVLVVYYYVYPDNTRGIEGSVLEEVS